MKNFSNTIFNIQKLPPVLKIKPTHTSQNFNYNKGEIYLKTFQSEFSLFESSVYLLRVGEMNKLFQEKFQKDREHCLLGEDQGGIFQNKAYDINHSESFKDRFLQVY